MAGLEVGNSSKQIKDPDNGTTANISTTTSSSSSTTRIKLMRESSQTPQTLPISISSAVSSPFNFSYESFQLFRIALPTMVVQLCTFAIYPLAASSVGHMNSNSPSSTSNTSSTTYLASFSLATLSGNITCLSLIIGGLSASETLQPRAFGLRQYNAVGLLAIRGFVFCSILLLPILFVLWNFAEKLYIYWGQDEIVAQPASDWVKIYVWGVPAVLLFRVVQRFLACQNVVLPCVYSSAIACLLVQPFMLRMLMTDAQGSSGWLLGGYGGTSAGNKFEGSAAALVVTQWVQTALTFAFLSRRRNIKSNPDSTSLSTSATATAEYCYFRKETWPGLSAATLREALFNWNEVHEYATLSIGGILSLSEWWFWEIICFIASKFGLLPFCVHTVAYQLIPMCFMIPLGLSIGLSVRIGIILSTRDVQKAKTLVKYLMAFTVILALATSCSLYYYQTAIVSLFTTDPEVIDGCKKIWCHVCIDIFLLFIFALSTGILRALGLQWRIAVTVFVVLWCMTIPTIVYFCLWKRGGLEVMWTIIPCAYALLDVGLTLCYINADWHRISRKIHEKKASKRRIVTSDIQSNHVDVYTMTDERTYLLNGDGEMAL